MQMCVCESAYIIHLLKPFAANLLANFFFATLRFFCELLQIEREICERKREGGRAEKYVVLLGVDKSTLDAAQKAAASRRE